MIVTRWDVMTRTGKKEFHNHKRTSTCRGQVLPQGYRATLCACYIYWVHCSINYHRPELKLENAICSKLFASVRVKICFIYRFFEILNSWGMKRRKRKMCLNRYGIVGHNTSVTGSRQNNVSAQVSRQYSSSFSYLEAKRWSMEMKHGIQIHNMKGLSHQHAKPDISVCTRTSFTFHYFLPITVFSKVTQSNTSIIRT